MTYVVQQGDTLRTIALQIYGDETRWELIYEANRGILSDPDAMAVGMQLVIPSR